MVTQTPPFRVRYADTDAQAAAYFGSHYAWFEAGRNELTRSCGVPYAEIERGGTCLPVARAFCRYYAPLRACETFRITTAVPALGRAKITFANRIVSADGQRPLAAGYTLHACTGPGGRPRGLPSELVDRLSPSS